MPHTVEMVTGTAYICEEGVRYSYSGVTVAYGVEADPHEVWEAGLRHLQDAS